MDRIFLSVIFFFSMGLAHAETVQIQPSSVVIHVGSADIIEGVYSDEQNGYGAYELLKLKVVGQYDEAVIAFNNIQPGKYQYRFAKISKDIVPFINCNFVNLDGRLENVRYGIEKQTDRRLLVSKKGAETAEIRLTAVLPDKEIGGPVIAMDTCGGDASVAQIIAWNLAGKPSTTWKSIEVKTAKNLVIRIPKDILEASDFELVLTK